MIHGRLAGDPRLVVRRWGGTQRLGNRGGLLHGEKSGGPQRRFRVVGLRRASGQHRQGASREVANQLVPDFRADGGGCLAADAALGDQVGQNADAVAGRTVGFAQDEAALRLFNVDDARFDDGAGGIDHPADGAIGAEDVPQRVVRVDPRQGFVPMRAVQVVEIPPGYAVHDERDRGVGTEQRPDTRGDL